MGVWSEGVAMSPVPHGDRLDSGHSMLPHTSTQERTPYSDHYDEDAYHEDDDGVLRPSSPQFETAPVDSNRARIDTAELIEQQFLDGRAVTATPPRDAQGSAPPSRDGQATVMSRYKQLWHFAYVQVCKQLGIKVR
jgi:hypothetical protein